MPTTHQAPSRADEIAQALADRLSNGRLKPDKNITPLVRILADRIHQVADLERAAHHTFIRNFQHPACSEIREADTAETAARRAAKADAQLLLDLLGSTSSSATGPLLELTA